MDDKQPEAGQTITHLEVHSHYTLLGGTASPAELAARAAADGLSHLALTDTNALYGAVAFEQACQEAGVQPILGMTLAVASPSEVITTGHSPAAGHLVLLATGPAGYRSLCRLSSLIQGRPEREALAQRGLSWDEVKTNVEGLICLSGGRSGWIERLVRAGNQAEARRYAAKLGGIFGEGAYLSLEIHDPADKKVAAEIAGLGQQFGLPTVACQPVLYLEAADYPRLQLLTAIGRNSSLEEISGDATLAEYAAGRHWQRPQEMAERFVDFPEALASVSQIVALCRPALPDGRLIWPVLELAGEGAVGLGAGGADAGGADAGQQTPDERLAQLARAGLSRRYGPDAAAEIEQRLEKELSAIAESGYAPLFVIVADVVRFAREREVPVSTRGSVANSLVAYCLEITTVDPIEHDLLFERFLNPARANPPDIDLDFCSRRRDEVLAYVRRAYGPERVALVATISTLRPKSAVRETAKAYGLAEGETGELVRQLPRGWHPDPRRRRKGEMADLLEKLEDPRHVAVISAARDIVGQPHHLSIHPGGVVITPGPLTDHVPVQWAPKGFLTTQFGHEDLEILGLPKLDLLGIRALTVLADAAELVRHDHDPASTQLATFRLAEIPLDDEATAAMLARGDTIGVFQCESSGARRTLRKLQAQTVFDLAVANAFFKPGPATGGMAGSFVRRYRGQEAVSYLHPALEPILGATKGVLLFQEQILRVATEIAGLSWEQADHLRRGMSKFQAQEMAAMQSQFEAGCRRPEPEGPGFSPEQAHTLWEQVLAFAGYGFNRGHATAYADVSYRSAYLKCHWPAAFFAARLADWGGFHHPAIYMAEAVRLGIPVRQPHVNYSNRAFTLTYDGDRGSGIGDRGSGIGDQLTVPDPQSPVPSPRSPVLYMGLGQVRDLRRSSVKEIIAARKERPFDSLQDLVERVALQSKELRHLVQCGALDGLGENRASLLAEAELADRAGSARQMSFDFARTPVAAESAAERFEWERRLLGQPVSVHPLDLVSDLPNVTRLADLERRRSRQLLTVAGTRLPGWTGGPGFFLGDGRDFVIVQGDERLEKPEPWLPLLLRGRWRVDEWGSGWFQVEETRFL